MKAYDPPIIKNPRKVCPKKLPNHSAKPTLVIKIESVTVIIITIFDITVESMSEALLIAFILNNSTVELLYSSILSTNIEIGVALSIIIIGFWLNVNPVLCSYPFTSSRIAFPLFTKSSASCFVRSSFSETALHKLLNFDLSSSK